MRLTFGFLAVLLLGCRSAGETMTDVERAALADSLSGFARQMMLDIDGHDVDKFIGHHENGPGFAWATSGALVPLDSMHATMRTYFSGPQGQHAHFSLGDVRAVSLGRNAGAVTAIINSTNRDSTGAERRSHQAWTIVVERREGRWRVVQAHESYPTEIPPQ